MEKIQMTTPLVEMDGDEMTRVLWKQIKDELLLPYIDLKTEYYDLGLPEREKTKDQVTVDSAEATKKYGVAVKCATITPNAQRVEEYKLSEMWKSPNGTIRAILDGTVFRAPIMVRGISPVVKTWKKPITIARHAYGDVYKSTEYRVPGPGKAELVFTGEDGKESGGYCCMADVREWQDEEASKSRAFERLPLASQIKNPALVFALHKWAGEFFDERLEIERLGQPAPY